MNAPSPDDEVGSGAPSEESGDADPAGREPRIRDHHQRGDLETAGALAIETYGAEIFGFLRALARDEDLASEAFSTFAEDLWKGLPGFRWEATLRTWAYALARHALYRVRRDPQRRAGRNLALSQVSAAALAVAVRSGTRPYLRTDVKDRFAALREGLDPDDHALLILRIDRRMSWRDIARALPGEGPAEPAGSGAPAEPAVVDRLAAALRKRYERAKAQLRQLARDHGLLGE
jgi:RNA polymerase sigma-70 factor, ECF subfamily